MILKIGNIGNQNIQKTPRNLNFKMIFGCFMAVQGNFLVFHRLLLISLFLCGLLPFYENDFVDYF